MKKYKGVKTLEVLEGADNYNSWIASRLSPYIEFPALEIGAGTGNISDFFSEKGPVVFSDNDPDLVDLLRQRFKGKKGVTIEIFDVAAKLGRITNRFRTVFAVNVLEHIKDDELALQNIKQLLLPGGRVIILVPAKKVAFTKLDRNLGHYRRYEKNELVEKIGKNGFTVEKAEYFNILGLASWLIRNKITRNHRSLKKSHVKFFDSVVPILRRVEPRSGLPIGISLIVIAKRTNHGKK